MKTKSQGQSLYEKDFYAWALTTASLLREKKMDDLDYENIIEEIEGMARSERRQLVNRLAVLLAHLLKWEYQPSYQGKSWQDTIREQRKRIHFLLADNPSLKSILNKSLAEAYELSVFQAARETGLSSFPDSCPYTFEQCLDDTFFPDASHKGV